MKDDFHSSERLRRDVEVLRAQSARLVLSQHASEGTKMADRLAAAHFEQVLQDVQVGVLVQNARAEVLLSNQAALDLLGLTEPQLLGKTSYDPDWNVIREDGTELSAEQHPVPLAIRTGKPVHNVIMGVYRPTKCDRIWLLVNADPQRDETGNLSQVICSFTDITARKEIDDQLKVNQRLYQAVVEGISDALFLINPEPNGEFRYVFINPACAQATGLTSEEVVGKRIREFFAPAYAEWVTAKFNEAIQAGKTIEYEESAEMPSGHLNVVTRLTPIFDEQGVCIQLVGAARNISEQKLAERSLRKTNRRLVNILESITDAFFSVDRQWRFTYLNPKAELLVGKTRQEMIGKNVWEIYPDLMDTAIYKECHRSVAKQVAVAVQEYIPRCGLWLQFHAYPSQDSLSVYAQDITANKVAEQEQRLSLERLRKSVDSIAKAMSLAVELRDPYTAGHQRRVSALACVIAREMGFTEESIEVVRIAGLVHDLGKIAIPAEILSKPGRLAAPEINLIQMHAQVGYDIFKEIEFAPPIALVALQHHERLDGSGYPAGLTDDQIILEAKIMAVADVVEAMASHRPYRPGLGIEKALEEILSNKGRLYHPPAVEACLQAFKQQSFDFELLIKMEER